MTIGAALVAVALIWNQGDLKRKLPLLLSTVGIALIVGASVADEPSPYLIGGLAVAAAYFIGRCAIAYARARGGRA